MAITTKSESRTTVRGLGEIALRVNNLDAMQKFYEEVIRLPLMTRVPNCAFFKIADGYGGHTQVLALFDRSNSPGFFPPKEHFTVGTVGNKDEMRFRIEVFNSVDGSCRLVAIAGWLRFVCTNGLIIGAALMQLHQQHRQQLQVAGIGPARKGGDRVCGKR